MRSADYLLKRLVFALATVLVAVTLNFVLFRLAPGDAVSNFSRVPHASPELRRAIAREFGLDQPKWRQYVVYLGQLAHGNLGVSYENQQPVSANLRSALGNTIPMLLAGTLLAILLGMVTGVLAAWRRGTAVDHASVSVALGFYSLPTQWLGLMLILLFAGILPTGGRTDEFLLAPGFVQHWLDVGKHMLLPALTVALTLYGEYTLVVRSTMLETLGEDYILTARAKGLAPWTVVRRHALRNALLPTATLVALSLGYIVAGQILIEVVFSWPGIGRATYQAVLVRDYPMLQGVFLVFTLTIVTLNLLADLLYVRLDPRIRE
jgi:ABC-type dipeptide/oligopeptide/nickel transport system permease component